MIGLTTVLELRKYSKAASSSVEAQHLKVLNIKNSIANKKPGHYETRVSLRIDAIPTENATFKSNEDLASIFHLKPIIKLAGSVQLTRQKKPMLHCY